jgi:iron transport multicopper oxidase
MDAPNISTGAERPGFPVQLSGNADNFPSLAFDPETEDQRPGLLLMNGVVYAAFGGNRDITPWQGWIFAVSASSGQITARRADNPEGDGAGIWQSGVGLTSDGPGTLLFVTGNGGSPTVPASTSSMPDSFGESVARLNVGTGGTLSAVDFFAPFDDTQLDSYDADFGAGASTRAPDS